MEALLGDFNNGCRLKGDGFNIRRGMLANTLVVRRDPRSATQLCAAGELFGATL